MTSQEGTLALTLTLTLALTLTLTLTLALTLTLTLALTLTLTLTLLQAVDVQLRASTQMLFMSAFAILGALCAIALASPLALLAAVPLGMLYHRLAAFYRSSSRELRRLESASQSPLYAALDEGLAGTATIRAFRAAPRLQAEQSRRLDDYARATFARAAASRWLGVRLELLGSVVLGACACLAVASTLQEGAGERARREKAGLAGLALSFAITITNSLAMLVQQVTALEMQMVNAERLLEYSELPQEEASPPPPPPAADWPAAGGVAFVGVSVAGVSGRVRPQPSPSPSPSPSLSPSP